MSGCEGIMLVTAKEKKTLRSGEKNGTLTYLGPSTRLNMSSMTTSSSVPRISVTLPAIHL